MGQELDYKGVNRAVPASGYTTGGPSPVGVSGQHSSTGALDVEANSAFLLGVYTPVSSSNVQGIQYDIEREVLTVTFNNDSTYEYPDVNPDTALSLLVAPSKGQWIWDNFRRRHKPFTKVGTFSGKIPGRGDG